MIASSFSPVGLKGFAERSEDDYPLPAKGNLSDWGELLVIKGSQCFG